MKVDKSINTNNYLFENLKNKPNKPYNLNLNILNFKYEKIIVKYDNALNIIKTNKEKENYEFNF